MKNNKYINLSNGIYFASLLFPLYVLINIIIQKSKTSDELCPVNNKQLIVVAIIILIIGTIISTILDKKKMR